MTFDEIESIIERMLAVQRELQESQLQLNESQSRLQENQLKLQESQFELKASQDRVTQQLAAVVSLVQGLGNAVSDHDYRIQQLERNQ
jgi:chromosome segregation ATPase